MDNLLNVLSTSFTSIAGDLTSALGTIVPIALGVVGAVLVVTFAVKMFKRLTGRGNS